MAKIFQVSARAGMTRVVEPIARALLRAGVTPNAVTVPAPSGCSSARSASVPAATWSPAR